MYRKLVKLDPNNGWRFSEVDTIALQRTARALREYIEANIPPQKDQFEVRTQVLPLCDDALSSKGKFPVKWSDLPLEYPVREALLPDKFLELWAAFAVRATGTPLEKPEEVAVHGKRHAYMEFEEMGDWPEEVNRRSEARRRARASSPD